jgi:WD40 repeat protein/transcriptional regulator with XRE-family HTH domain/energy-coupling factor transporter ATP-binding protein EcfA2
MAIPEQMRPERGRTFGTLLRARRLEAGLTQAALAEHAGLSVRGIQHLEAGLGQPYASTALRLADALELAPADRALFESAARGSPRRSNASRRAFDVFLCYDGEDIACAERIARGLKAAGLEPWFDCWYSPPSEDLDHESVFRDALKASSTCAVLVGAHGIEDWESGALGQALRRAERDRTFRLFPVLLPGLSDPFDPTRLPLVIWTAPWVDLRSGLDDSLALRRLTSAIRGTLAEPNWPAGLADSRCPYRGLQAFEEVDAELFFGREADLQRLVERLKTTRFLAVIGPSGSGKSSLVRAGLLPALRRGAVQGSSDWTQIVFTPGAEPLTALASQLAPGSAVAAVQRMVDRLARDPRTLHVAMSPGRDAQPRVLLVIDQFEEIFSQCDDERDRAQFVANLLYASAVPDGRTQVVVTMRADFYARCAVYPELAARIAANQHLLGSLDTAGLRQAIEGPARRVGLTLESGLVDTILDEVAGEPGALPLLEHALLELWGRRQGSVLTWTGYRASGGVQTALAQRAEAVHSSLGIDDQMVARRVLVRLTQLGDSTEDIRRRVALGELVSAEQGRDATERVVRALADARLVTTGGDIAGGEGWVEVAHEALIRSWPRLREWLDEDRAALRLRWRLSEAARDWQRLERDEGSLYRGAALAAAVEWQEAHNTSLNDREREFLDASLALQERDRLARERQRRLLTVSLGLGFVLALVLGGVAVLQWWQADVQRAAAEEARQTATARELAFQADAVRTGSAVLLPRSVLLAAETLKRFSSREAESTLRQGLALLSRPLVELSQPARVRAVAYSPDGQYLATAEDDGSARVWSVASSQQIVVVTHENAVRAITWSPDGRYLATGSDDGTSRIWDAVTGHEMGRSVHGEPVYAIAFSPDGQRLASATTDGRAQVWDWVTGPVLTTVSHDAPAMARYSPDGGSQYAESTAQSIAFSADGHYLLTARSADRTARVWDATSGRELARLEHNDVVLAAAFSPDAHYVATGSADGTARLWDMLTGREIEMARMAIERGAPIFSIAFSPDGHYLAAGGAGSISRIEEIPSGVEVASLWNDDTVQQVAFSPNGRYLATASNDRTARIWLASSGQAIARMPMDTAGAVYALAFSPDGRSLATVTEDNTLRVWEAMRPWQDAGLPHHDNVIFVTFSPDGRYLASTAGNTVTVWDASTGQELLHLTHPSVAWAIQFSPDSRSLLTSSFDGNARIWELGSGAQVAQFHHGDNVRVWGAQFSPDGRYVATAGQEGNVRVWEVASGREVMLAKHDAAAGQPRFTPDGRYLITGSVDRTARMWDIATGREVLRIELDYPVNDLAIDPSGRYLAVGDDQTASIWELSSARRILYLPHETAVNGVAFSPDGRYLATAARNGIARLWDVATGEQLAAMAHDKPLNGLAFSPDGRYLATASNDHTVRLWVPILQDPVAAACGRVTRNLSPEEWRQYLRDEPYGKTCPDLP